MIQDKFIELEHMADIKFRLRGKTLSNLFENAALAFSNYIADEKRIKQKKTIKVSIEANDLESLLYKFLDELIYLLDAKGFAVSKALVRISKDQKSLSASIYGDSIKHYVLNHVKAATYAEMYIKKLDRFWEAQLVLDI